VDSSVSSLFFRSNQLSKTPDCLHVTNSGLEIATTFWWLVTFAVLASEATAWGIVEGYTYVDGYGDSIYVDSYLPSNWKSAIDSAKASAGLGALEWVLFIITLIMFGMLPCCYSARYSD
jgi:hypothetical protein